MTRALHEFDPRVLQVGCFKWRPPPGYRSKFEGAYVNILRNQVARHLRIPHEFFCVTDDPSGIDEGVRVIPLWEEFGHLPSPHVSPTGTVQPSCYRRLPLWGKGAGEFIGRRMLLLDLDMVICADITPIIDIPDDFKIWGDTAKNTPYNGSMVLMDAGARSQVYDTFDPIESPKKGRALGYIGSDQAWIGACLGLGEKKFGPKDGVFSYRNEIAPKGGILPANARIVIYHGHVDPWSVQAQRLPWVKKHYR